MISSVIYYISSSIFTLQVNNSQSQMQVFQIKKFLYSSSIIQCTVIMFLYSVIQVFYFKLLNFVRW
jgi:hypothetical protein